MALKAHYVEICLQVEVLILLTFFKLNVLRAIFLVAMDNIQEIADAVQKVL